MGGGVRHVPPRHDHVLRGAAQAPQRVLQGPERGALLPAPVARADVPVRADPRRTGDADDGAVAHGTREAELEFPAASGRVHAAVCFPRGIGRHQLRILLITASANSLVPTADGSSRSALRSYVTSLPSATTEAIARSSRSPASRSPMCRSMSTPASMSAMGLTLFC